MEVMTYVDGVLSFTVELVVLFEDGESKLELAFVDMNLELVMWYLISGGPRRGWRSFNNVLLRVWCLWSVKSKNTQYIRKCVIKANSYKNKFIVWD